MQVLKSPKKMTVMIFTKMRLNFGGWGGGCGGVIKTVLQPFPYYYFLFISIYLFLVFIIIHFQLISTEIVSIPVLHLLLRSPLCGGRDGGRVLLVNML